MKSEMVHKFKPDIEIVFDVDENKFTAFKLDMKTKTRNQVNNTFCFDSKLLSILIQEHEMKTFLIKEKYSFWGYSKNLMFEAIDFDIKSDVWFCKVLGYIE